MTSLRTLEELQSRRLEAQRRLAGSCAPEDERPKRTVTFSDRVERGAMAIYGRVTRTDDPGKLAEKWAHVAKPITKDRHRAEAEACLRVAS